MKIEPRGKYAGVKVHLDGEEAGVLLDILDKAQIDELNTDKFIYELASVGGDSITLDTIRRSIQFASNLGGKIHRLIQEVPNLLEDRTEAQIKEALEGDQEKIEKQLAAFEKGKDWKKVK